MLGAWDNSENKTQNLKTLLSWNLHTYTRKSKHICTCKKTCAHHDNINILWLFPYLFQNLIESKHSSSNWPKSHGEEQSQNSKETLSFRIPFLSGFKQNKRVFKKHMKLACLEKKITQNGNRYKTNGEGGNRLFRYCFNCSKNDWRRNVSTEDLLIAFEGENKQFIDCVQTKWMTVQHSF